MTRLARFLFQIAFVAVAWLVAVLILLPLYCYFTLVERIPWSAEIRFSKKV